MNATIAADTVHITVDPNAPVIGLGPWHPDWEQDYLVRYLLCDFPGRKLTFEVDIERQRDGELVLELVAFPERFWWSSGFFLESWFLGWVREHDELPGWRLAEALLANQEKIPESWREFRLVFPGTLWYERNGFWLVRSLWWLCRDDEWVSSLDDVGYYPGCTFPWKRDHTRWVRSVAQNPGLTANLATE